MASLVVGSSTLALATSWSSNHVRYHRGEPLIWLFLPVFELKLDLGRLENNHVATAAALLAGAAPPAVLAEVLAVALRAAALLALPAVTRDQVAKTSAMFINETPTTPFTLIPISTLSNQARLEIPN